MIRFLKKIINKIFGSQDEPPSIVSKTETGENKPTLSEKESFLEGDSELEVDAQKFDSGQNEEQSLSDKVVTSPERVLDLIIGFDLGTSSSKVVVQAPDLPDSPAWPIDFGDLGYGDLSYILPTIIYYNPENDTLSLHNKTGSELPYIHIKTGLCTNTVQLEDIIEHNEFNVITKEALAAAYLGLALRYVRKFISSEQSELLSSFNKIYWSLNLGIPSPTLDHFDEKESFERVIKIAWVLSASNSVSISLAAIENEIKEYNKEIESHSNVKVDCEIHLIPEIIAGSFGYTQSARRSDGLHIILDIGAFTVDVCGFRLSRHNETYENISAIFLADVQPLGTICFHIMNGHTSYLDPVDDEIENSDVTNLEKKFLTMIRRLICQLKNTHDRNARAFQSDQMLPFIIIGGGSQAKIYKEWIDHIDQWIMFQHIKNKGLDFLKVPLPDDWPDVRDLYLSVAWGLSHRKMDIGKFIAPSEITDLPPVEVEQIPDGVSKDQV